MNDFLDEKIARSGYRLTPNAKRMLVLILESILTERIDWINIAEPESKEIDLRTRIVHALLIRLPKTLEDIESEKRERNGANINPDLIREITVFDMLHHLETGLDRNFLFPGKLPK